jgi:hypothetical protein
MAMIETIVTALRILLIRALRFVGLTKLAAKLDA